VDIVRARTLGRLPNSQHSREPASMLRPAAALPPLALLLVAACSSQTPPPDWEDGLDAGRRDAYVFRRDASRPDAALPPGPDAAAPVAYDAGDEGPLPPARLFSVDPPSGGCSATTEVVLSGEGFLPVASVEVGGVAAGEVLRLDSKRLVARFPPLDLKERGKKLVRVTFEDRTAVSLQDGFEYLFDEDPIVFVHGFMLSPFGTLVDRFKQAGYPDEALWRIDFSDAYGSSLVNAEELRVFVADVLAKTGAPKVDLVIHSMGGLSSRWYLWNGGDAFVRDYVGIAGAFHGTLLAYATVSDGAEEMRPPYACQGESLNDLQFMLNGCLTDDGRAFFVDETPFGVEEGGTVSYLSISSEQDEFIVPTASSCLNQAKKNDCSDAANVRVSWLGHGTILLDQGVFDRTIEHLRKRNRSKP
jgi:pimeloyl-ACP methyl ester carboxylesterase